MRKFSHPIIIFACILLGFGFAKKLAELLRISIVHYNGSTNMAYFFLGFVLFLVTWFFIKGHVSFLRVFIHEANHVVFQLLSGYKPRKFFVSDTEGGYVSGTGHNFLVILAPYFFPLLVVASLLLFLVINQYYYKPYFFILGVLTSFHILVSLDDYISQSKSDGTSDINRLGKVFSTAFIVFANMVIYGAILAFVNGGFSGMQAFLIEGFQENLKIYTMVLKTNLPRHIIF